MCNIALYLKECFLSLTGFIDALVAADISANYDLEHANTNETMIESQDKI